MIPTTEQRSPESFMDDPLTPCGYRYCHHPRAQNDPLKHHDCHMAAAKLYSNGLAAHTLMTRRFLIRHAR